jgi:hypothetical protein
MVSQMELLSRLCDALALVRFGDEALARIASRLVELVQRLQPGRAARDDRPRAVPGKEAEPHAKPRPIAKKARPVAVASKTAAVPVVKKATKKRARPAAKPR